MRHRRRLVIGLSAAIAIALVPAVAAAQIYPSATHYMYDARPNTGYPPTYPGLSQAPEAVVVEGLGGSIGNCQNSNYSESKIESQTVSWVNSGYRTATEITPQSGCDTAADFESLIGRIVSYVESHASANAPVYWAGMMLDEEPSFGSSSYYQGINAYTRNLMASTPGMSFVFIEAEPNGWTSTLTGDIQTYYSLAQGAWAAPQVYSQNMLNVVNGVCTTYSSCTNLVTLWGGATSPWNTPSHTLPLVNGPAWSTTYSTWFSGAGWWNGFRAS